MAGEHTVVAEHTEASNGASGANGTAGGDRAGMTRAQRDAADRDAFLAGMGEDEEGEAEVEAPAEKAAPKKKPAKVEDVVEDDEPDEVANEIDEDEDDVDLDDDLDDELDELEAATDDEEAAGGKADPAIAAQHAKIRKLETRMRQGIAKERAAHAAEINSIVGEWKPKIEAAQAFEKIPKSDVLAIMKAKGYTEDDWEDLGKIFYGHSKAGAADPKNRDAVARLKQQRELRDELAETKSRQAALEKRLEERDSSDATQKKVDQYMARVTKAASPATPILKEMLDIAPKKTTNVLMVIAQKLAQKNGGNAVDPKQVALAYEKQRRAAGVTVESVRALRKNGSTAAATIAGKGKPAIKVVDKTAATVVEKKKPTIPSRADMIERIGQINRGELDPDAD